MTQNGGKTGRVALAPAVVRGLDEYLAGRATGPLLAAGDGTSRYGYKIAHEQLGRLCRSRPTGWDHPAQSAALLRH